jgi:DNA repair exonuclease SbcCD ATPase subunit
MITFESIRWKNFLSTGDQWTEMDLSSTMSTLIVGPNGAGKSTMLDALCFGLFNKPFRKINRGQLVNSVNEKGLKVEVCFTIGKDDYRVFRGAKPNIFEVYKNNKMVDQDAAARDTQKYLEQSVLKLNYKSFTQVVILGSSTFVPFMQLSASHRREVIEDLLDINIFSNMNSLLKDRIRNAINQDRDCQHLLKMAEERLNSQIKLIGSLQEVNDSRQKEKEDKYAENNHRITEYEKEKDEKEEHVKELELEVFDTKPYHEMLEDLRQKKSEVTSDLKVVNKELTFFKKNTQCPTCHQHIDETLRSAKVELLTQTGQELSKAMGMHKDQLEESIKVIEKMDEKALELREARSDVNILDKDIIRLKYDNIELQKQLSELQSTPNLDLEKETLDKLEKEYEKTQKNCAGVSKQLDEYHVIGTLLKDSGIKRQIIKKYVPIFNTLINKYLHNMDTFFNFTLDEEFNEVIKSRFRDEFTYSSFSEGEKQKIDLALLFTWREVARMKNSVATNLLILDEVFDSSLDASATAELLSILRGLGETTNLFVISHKGDILADKFFRTLRFDKVNDFSKMSDDS